MNSAHVSTSPLWIEVTHFPSGDKVLINLACVEFILPRENGRKCQVSFPQAGNFLLIAESYQTVANLIQCTQQK